MTTQIDYLNLSSSSTLLRSLHEIRTAALKLATQVDETIRADRMHIHKVTDGIGVNVETLRYHLGLLINDREQILDAYAKTTRTHKLPIDDTKPITNFTMKLVPGKSFAFSYGYFDRCMGKNINDNPFSIVNSAFYDYKAGWRNANEFSTTPVKP